MTAASRTVAKRPAIESAVAIWKQLDIWGWAVPALIIVGVAFETRWQLSAS